MRLIVIVSFLVLYSFTTFSQTEDSTKTKHLKLGYNISPNISDVRSGSDLPKDVTIFNTPNYRMGFWANYSFNDAISISPEVDWSFNEGGFRFSDTSKADYKLMLMSFDFMMHVIIKKQRESLSPYVLLGPNVRVPVLNNSRAVDFPTRSDVAINLGLGLEKRFKYISFSPELRYTFGFSNISDHPDIPSAYLNNVSLVLNLSMR